MHAIATFETGCLNTIEYITTASFPKHPPGYQPNTSNHLIVFCRQAQVKESLTVLVEYALALIADLNVWFNDPCNPLRSEERRVGKECPV